MIPNFGSRLGVDLPAYFVMLVAAFAACTLFAVRWARREGRDHEVMIDLSLLSVITGVLGARIAHVLFDGYLMDYVHLCTDHTQVAWRITQQQCAAAIPRGSLDGIFEAIGCAPTPPTTGIWDAAAEVCRPHGQDCFAWLAFWNGGLTWYGGMIAGIAGAMVFLRRADFPRIKTLDMGGMVLPLGLFFGRLGCWFGGCCFGLTTDAWYGVSFPGNSPASEQQWRQHLLDHPWHESLPVIPAQLMEAGGSLLIAFFVIGVVEPRKRFDGQVFCVSMILYALLRFGLEFLRNDDRGGFGGLTTSQWIGVLLVAGCAALWPIFRRRTDAAYAAAAAA